MKKKYKVVRQSISRRGGGIEVHLDGLGFEGEKMTAYCNYLGGGMLGKISNDCTIEYTQHPSLVAVAEELRKDLASAIGISYNDNQGLPVSAY